MVLVEVERGRERVSLGKVRTGWEGFERHWVRFVKVRIVSLRREEVG